MKITIGDIIEIKTSKGLAYALYTHKYTKPPKYGALIRVFSGIFDKRPDDVKAIVNLPVQFSTFFPLGTAIQRRAVEIVLNVTVPENLKAFPLFRVAGLMDLKSKKVKRWGLWNGVKSSSVINLTAEQRKLPILGVWNGTMLIHRIEAGWRPELDPR